MKFKHRATAFLLSVLMLFTSIPAFNIQAFAAEFTPELEICQDGSPVSEVVLSIQEKVYLSTETNLDGAFQWQIRLADNVWANIIGENNSSIELSYAMVANLLKGNQARIRCKLATDVGEVYSKAVIVDIDFDSVPQFPVQPELKLPTVIQGAIPEHPDEPVERLAKPDSQLEIMVDPEEMEPVVIPAAPVTPDESSDLVEESFQRESTGNLSFFNGTLGQGDAEDDPVLTTHLITIEYVLEDGTPVAEPFGAQVADGSNYNNSVSSPLVTGYKPIDNEKVIDLNYINVTSDITIRVIYYPAEVDFKVEHYQQNIYDDGYTLIATDTISDHETGSNVGEGLDNVYPGFVALLYDETTQVAADASTIVKIYYDRLYFLMSFDLGGGYGVDPIYARYGTPIGNVGQPTKAGHTFDGWNPNLPGTMPNSNTTYTAKWIPATTARVTVVYWVENADDNEYSYYSSKEVTMPVGSSYTNTENPGLATNLWQRSSSDTVTVAADGSSIVNVYYNRRTFTFTFRADSRTIHSFSAKWGSDISDKWSFTGSNGTQYPQQRTSWKPSGSSTYTQRITRLERMPAENITFTHTTTNNTIRHFYYYVESLPGTSGHRTVNGKNYDLYLDLTHDFNVIFYNDDFFLLEGFTRDVIRQENNNQVTVSIDGTNWNSSWNSKLYFYYTRNSYNLILNNGEENQITESVYYRAPLAQYDSIEPTLPSFYEPGSREFDGWYLNPQGSGEKYDLTTHTMPAANLILYAKWVPIIRTVTTRLTEDATVPLDTWNVPHGSVVPTAPENPVNGEYEFVGWFYKDNGVEKAFDFSMQVRKDMDLYAKWRSNKVMPITIHYVTMVNGVEVPIAEESTSSGLAGTTKTFEAKTGSDLYDDYQVGFFPATSSHNLEIEIEGENEYTFVYVAKEKVGYTVKFLEEGTNEVLHEERVGETNYAVITEEYERITGYRPDAFQKRLVLSADDSENVLIFYYVKDEVHAPVQISHYTENITGGGYSLYQEETNLYAVIGQTYDANVISIPGFTFDGNIEGTLMEGTLTEEGLHLKLYYTRNSYPYKFRFLEQGTNKILVDPVDGTAKYQSSVTENAKVIEGYELVGPTQQTVIIAIEEGEAAVNNVKTFYYTEKEVIINYVALGPVGEDFGSVTPGSETVKVKTGSPAGSAPTASNGYRFEGWYLDAACTQPVNATWVENDKITPQKNDGLYQAATYYGKFVPDVADLTITKSGAENIDENQSFVFRVVGDGLDGTHIDMEVVIRGNGSVTIKDLPCGSYTVTEETTWSWRYSPTSGTQSVNLTPANATVSFSNTRTVEKWLNGASWSDNRWIDGNRH